MSYLYSFLLGGTVVVVVNFLARNSLAAYAGVLMTFPAITLVSIIITPDKTGFHIAEWGLIGLCCSAVMLGIFLAAKHYLQWNKYGCLAVALAAWLIVVLGIAMLKGIKVPSA